MASLFLVWGSTELGVPLGFDGCIISRILFIVNWIYIQSSPEKVWLSMVILYTNMHYFVEYTYNHRNIQSYVHIIQ